MFENIIRCLTAWHGLLTAPVGILPTTWNDAIIVIRFGA